MVIMTRMDDETQQSTKIPIYIEVVVVVVWWWWWWCVVGNCVYYLVVVLNEERGDKRIKVV
jgi:hypothetical protein